MPFILTLPPLPSWDGLHPLVVHFPVALLLVAPVLVLLGLLSRNAARGWFLAALMLMAMGTVAIWVAVPTGEAAARLAERSDLMAPVLLRHEQLAEQARMAFTALILLFLAGLLGSHWRRPGRRVAALLMAGFLILYAGGALVLANTAHNGGQLVHQFGVHAQ